MKDTLDIGKAPLDLRGFFCIQIAGLFVETLFIIADESTWYFWFGAI
ncbi:MAG: hypothetical protein ACQEUD_16875 [Bacillota bacterium]